MLRSLTFLKNIGYPSQGLIWAGGVGDASLGSAGTAGVGGSRMTPCVLIAWG